MSMSYRNYLLLCISVIIVLPVVAIFGPLIWSYYNADTVFTAQLDKQRFDALVIGDDVKTVLREIGPPLDIIDWDEDGRYHFALSKTEEITKYLNQGPSVMVKQTWYYSKQGRLTADWWFVGVEFDREMTISKKFWELTD